MAGRPTKFSKELGDEICRMIGEGYSARSVCTDKSITLATLYRWLRENEEFKSQYDRAREDAADTLVDELMEIADTEDDVQRAKLKIDARKWVASRMKPKSWGEKQQHEHSGPDGGPLEVSIVRYGEDSSTQ